MGLATPALANLYACRFNFALSHMYTYVIHNDNLCIGKNCNWGDGVVLKVLPSLTLKSLNSNGTYGTHTHEILLYRIQHIIVTGKKKF